MVMLAPAVLCAALSVAGAAPAALHAQRATISAARLPQSSPRAALRDRRRAQPAMLAEYGAQLPPTEQLAGFALVTVLTATGYVVWDQVLVPQKRLELSKSKRQGEVKQLLDEIEADDSRGAERWFFRDWLQARSADKQQGGRKPAALPFLPATKFNSGDNPVIGAVALIMLTGVVSSSLRQLGALVMAASSGSG